MGERRDATDPGEALATLTDVSSQIEGAVILDEGSAVLASSFPSEQAGSQVAAAASALIRAARAHGGEGRSPLTHLLVETADGAVFVVGQEGKVIVAVTGSEPTVGLVFYDLKVTLREATPPPRRRSGGTARRKTGAAKDKGSA